MNNSEKADLYDQYVRLGGQLETENNNLKANNAFKMTPEVENQIKENQKKIDFYGDKLTQLVNS